jgi:type I restriction enzyme S subunit
MKYLVNINTRALPEDEDPGRTFRYLDITSVGRGSLSAPPTEMTFGAAPSRARRLVRPGDTILSTVRTYLRSVWPVAGETDDLVVSTGFAVLTPGRRLDSRFLGWWAQGDRFVEEIVARSVGVSYPAINALEVGDIAMPVPPVREQRAIADYLNAETARIDALVAKKRRMIDLLDQRFWHSFVDRVRASGERVAQLRRALTFLTDGPFGNAFTSSDYSSGGAAVVRLGNIGFAEYRPADQAFIPMELYGKLLRHRVRPDDLLIAGLGDDRNHAGRACVAPNLGPAMVKGKCFCARVRRDLGVPEYLALLLSSPLGAAAMGLSSRGSTRSMINLDVVKAALVPLPPAVDQERIVRESLTERAKIQRLTAALRGQLELLSEHRQALITEAVTGQSEVTQVVT